MSRRQWEGDDQYDSYFEGAEAKLYRRDWLEEMARVTVIETLLHSVGPDDAVTPLFTFAEMKQWGLKHCRKRARE